MDFTGEHPQFVSGSHKAHKIMDILVAGFFTAMTFETRRAEYIRSKPKLPPVLLPSWVPTGAAAATTSSTNTSDFEELLTCGICFRIMHHPVALITARTNLHGGCCKSH